MLISPQSRQNQQMSFGVYIPKKSLQELPEVTREALELVAILPKSGLNALGEKADITVSRKLKTTKFFGLIGDTEYISVKVSELKKDAKKFLIKNKKYAYTS